jgi:DNA modification methylase
MIKIFNEDCLKTLEQMEDSSVDLFCQDTPFGCTKNPWDVKPDLQNMWKQWLRVGKENCAFVFFAQQPFTTDLINSNRDHFRYDIVWEKTHPKGFLNANKMPLRSHESILVFYKKLPTYNPQKTIGHNPVNSYTKHISDGTNYGKTKKGISGGGSTERYPRSVIKMSQDTQKSSLHPTQKPVELIQWIIRSYSNLGDLVFDGYVGSGTTAEACFIENRNFKGSELDRGYFENSIKRLSFLNKIG